MNSFGRRWLTATLGLVCVVLVLGCGAVGKVRQAAARSKRVNELKAVGLAYHNYCDTYAKGPKGVKDLEPFLRDFPEALRSVQNGDIIVLWGANVPADFPQGTSNTVLGYDKDVPTQGGPVLLGDASTKIMTAQEFQAAPRPKNAK